MKNIHLFIIILAQLLLSNLSANAQTKLVEFQDKLIGLTSDSTINKKINIEEAKSIDKFWEIFKEIRNKEIGLGRLKGKANFSFLGNNSEASRIFRLNVGVKLKKGAFPNEFQFSTLSNLEINNGKLRENLSNLRVSYNRFIGKPNNFTFEGFSSINRRSDELLGVDKRYEIGGGVILAYWHQKLLPKAQKELDKFSKKELEFKTKIDKIILCNQEVKCVPINLKGITTADSATYNQVRIRIKNSIIKTNSPLKVGILTGFFIEVESISHSDSLKTNRGKEFFIDKFESLAKLRWELRPILDFKLSSDISFTIQPSIKLPMPWEWKAKLEGEEVTDLRIETPFSMNVELQEGFTLSINYAYYHDNAPSSKVLGNIGVDNAPLFLTAKKSHHYYSFSFGYKFD